MGNYSQLSHRKVTHFRVWYMLLYYYITLHYATVCQCFKHLIIEIHFYIYVDNTSVSMTSTRNIGQRSSDSFSGLLRERLLDHLSGPESPSSSLSGMSLAFLFFFKCPYRASLYSRSQIIETKQFSLQLIHWNNWFRLVSKISG